MGYFRIVVVMLLLAATQLGAQTLKQVATINLPGPAGKRFDYLTLDTQDHYLLSAHLGAGILYVIDLRNNRLVKAIPDVPGVRVWSTCPSCTRSTPPTGTKTKSG
jgi:hypothetical protein